MTIGTDGADRRFSGILHDLTTRVRLEEQLREQAALARLGEMAAVIAHEVRNPLAGVRGAVQIVGARLPKESNDSAIIEEIVSRVDGLNGLMQDLLLFARPPRPKPGSTGDSEARRAYGGSAQEQSGCWPACRWRSVVRTRRFSPTLTCSAWCSRTS